MPHPKLLVEHHPAGYRWLRLARPERRNALDPGLMAAVRDTLAAEPGTPVVLGSTDPRVFCAGADLTISDAERSVVSDLVYDCCQAIVTRPGPVIAGPLVRDLRAASVSARAALAALHAAPAWPDAPRPTGADELLPERALDGDDDARAALISDVYEPLLGGGPALLDTLTTYLEQGSSLEATARLLFVHPNTVRYRLRRVAELTEYTPSVGRDGFTLWVAIALGRLAARRAEGTRQNLD